MLFFLWSALQNWQIRDSLGIEMNCIKSATRYSRLPTIARKYLAVGDQSKQCGLDSRKVSARARRVAVIRERTGAFSTGTSMSTARARCGGNWAGRERARLNGMGLRGVVRSKSVETMASDCKAPRPNAQLASDVVMRPNARLVTEGLHL